ncbi:hypothetical protein A3Q56_02348 [Intoshia linei]|uniref:Uncharacterized protein n=1 Tax=Intoshia linei TaxID=1819745 RepID=A0A177B6K3_9BILA|nr:hypothetical protein A3Q56_02348 [Intoshia linei]
MKKLDSQMFSKQELAEKKVSAGVINFTDNCPKLGESYTDEIIKHAPKIKLYRPPDLSVYTYMNMEREEKVIRAPTLSKKPPGQFIDKYKQNKCLDKAKSCHDIAEQGFKSEITQILYNQIDEMDGLGRFRRRSRIYKKNKINSRKLSFNDEFVCPRESFMNKYFKVFYDKMKFRYSKVKNMHHYSRRSDESTSQSLLESSTNFSDTNTTTELSVEVETMSNNSKDENTAYTSSTNSFLAHLSSLTSFKSDTTVSIER